MFKKIFIVSAVIFVVAISALVVQRAFFNEGIEKENIVDQIENRQEVATKEVEKRTTDENAKRAEKIIKIIDSDVREPVALANKEQVLYYNNQRFLLVDFNGGSRTSVGAYPFVSVENISWDAKRKKALVNDNGKFYVYDLDKNDVQYLGDGVDIVAWEQKGSRVVYKYYDEKTQKRVIGMMDPYDEESRRVLVDDVSFKAVSFAQTPIVNQMCYYPFSETNIKDFLRCYDWEKKEMTLEYEGKYGADYLWSNDGANLLVSYIQERGDNRMFLGVSNEKGSELKALSFSTTVKKCVWSKDNKHVYCALMSGASDLIEFPDDWDNGKFESVDTFWKINTVTGGKERLIDVEKIPTAIDATNLFIDNSESHLFFTDRKNGALYRISL